MNSTRVTPTLSLAVAVRAMMPLLPVAAAVAVGGVVSFVEPTLFTTKLTDAELPTLPAAS